jgi:hypothetical protein
MLLRCGCGLSLNNHEGSVQSEYEKNKKRFKFGDEIWEPNKSCTSEDRDTDAFGDIRFNYNNDLISKVFPIINQND